MRREREQSSSRPRAVLPESGRGSGLLKAAPERREALELLVVEDDAEVGRLIASIAEDLGFGTEVAFDFRGFERAIHQLDGVIVLDLNLPEVDGVEILRNLGDRGYEFPVILISGVGERVVRAAEKLATERGLWVLGTLTKPFLPQELRDLLRRSQDCRRLDPKAKLPLRRSREEILDTLRGGHLEVHYQPKVEMATGEVSGLEALARLRPPGQELIPPSQFVRLAEEEGLIDGLTARVCAQALTDCGRWQRIGLDAGVSVNFSVRSLHGLELPDVIHAMARNHGVAPESLVVEVTESSLAQEPVRALDILTRLRLKGFGLSIDDFGTGYSTMRQLERIPFCELKLDRTFVQGASSSDDARAIMSSSVELAHRLKMKVVAEGVETWEHWDLAASLGCDEAQGFLTARPMPIKSLIHWLKALKDRNPPHRPAARP